MSETIQTIANIACICFCVYGIIVFARLHATVEKANIAIDEALTALRD